MTTPKQAVDSVLGKGWYDEWQKMEQSTKELKKRSEVNVNRYTGLGASEILKILSADAQLLERVSSDYGKAMNLLVTGGKVDTKRLGEIHDVFTLALGVVEEDNKLLDSAFTAGVVAAFVAIPLAMLQQTAERLAKLLEVLKILLEQAKRERTEAYVQTAVNAAISVITVVTTLTGPIGLAIRAGIFGGQWILDSALGPKKSTTVTVLQKSSHAAEQLLDHAGEMEKVGKKTQRVAKGAGIGFAVTGFFFDANEVLLGYRNVDQIRTAMSQAKKTYDDLIADFNRHKPALTKFQVQWRTWKTSIQDTETNARLTRDALNKAMKDTGYKPV